MTTGAVHQRKRLKQSGEDDELDYTTDSERIGSEWPTKSTEDLLIVLKEQMENFVKGKIKSKRKMFELCAESIKKKGHPYTYIQCENKWKSLKRRYVTNYDRLLMGRQPQKSRFQKPKFDNEIQEILKLEKPCFQKELEEFTRVNSLPPRLSPKPGPENQELDDDQEYENYEGLEEYNYVEEDEKLVRLVLEEDASPVVKHKNEPYEVCYEQPEVDDSLIDAETLRINQEKNSRLINEVKELKEVVKISLDTNSDILKAHNSTHEQMLNFLESFEKQEFEKIELKKQNIQKQAELVQQIKIQNSLIAKLIQKIDNSSSNVK